MCVVRCAAISFIDGRVTLRVATWMRVITSADKQTSVGSKLKRTGMMATFFSLLFEFQQKFFARKIKLVTNQRETADVLADKIGR